MSQTMYIVAGVYAIGDDHWHSACSQATTAEGNMSSVCPMSYFQAYVYG